MHKLVPLVVLLFAPACFIVAIEDGTTGAPLSFAYVFVKSCPTCPEEARFTGHDEAYPGMAYWNAYAGDVPVNAGVGAEAARVTVWKQGYATRTKFIKPNYQLSSTDQYFQISTIKLYTGWDSDGDRLVDQHELAIGTNPWVMDTDDDGLDDGVEVDGKDWVDYAALGADPRRRDLFVEIDYVEYVQNGVVKSARPGPTAIAALTALYGSLPIANPDGSQGIAVHLIFDDVLPQGTICTDYDTTMEFDALHRQAFHYGKLCLGSSYGGQALVGNQRFTTTVNPPNADPSDDASETSPFMQYSGIAHELAHTLGLWHGGNEEVNCKPNYPSLMNYAYSTGLNGTTLRIDQTFLAFSSGRFLDYPLDEHALIETASFPGVPPAELGFLATAGFTLQGGAVDWDADGTFETTPVAVNIQTSDEACDDTLSVLHDHDDIALIRRDLGGTIPAWKWAYQFGGVPEVVCPTVTID